MADGFAAAVGTQWEAEAAVRRLNDPYPLPVSWDAADPSLSDAWDLLVKLAGSGAGWPEPPPPGTWVAGPECLAGSGRDLVEVLARVPTGRLVVLGDPGSGKTMLMVRLVLDLLARRSRGDPVPVLVSAASWNPADPDQDLRSWLAAQLVTVHPDLAAAPPPGRDEPTCAAALLAAGLVTPLLDGLDEIPDEVRGPAVTKINDMLQPGKPFVVTCRSQEYEDVVRPQGGSEVTLRGSAAVQLLPLMAEDVRGYLCDDAAGPVAKARWDPVLQILGTDTPTGQALRTPLMVALARAIYNPRPGELAGNLRDPAELCQPNLTDRAAVESVLFDAFIPSAYRQRGPTGWDAQDAQRWLTFLAGHLERKIARPDLAWWQLPQAVSHIALVFWAALTLVLTLIGGITGAVTGGLSGVSGLSGGIVTGVAIAASANLLTFEIRRRSQPVRGMRVNIGGLVFALVGGLLGGLIAGLMKGPAFGVMGGMALLATNGLVVGLKSEPSNLAAALSPRTLLARDRRAALLIMSVSGLVFGVAFVFSSEIAGGLKGGLTAWLLVGLTGGFLGAVVMGVSRTVWPSYMLARWWLAFHRQLPWRLMSFLDDAHQRGVLRQVGTVYQFRHIELQHQVARLSNASGIS